MKDGLLLINLLPVYSHCSGDCLISSKLHTPSTFAYCLETLNSTDCTDGHLSIPFFFVTHRKVIYHNEIADGKQASIHTLKLTPSLCHAASHQPREVIQCQPIGFNFTCTVIICRSVLRGNKVGIPDTCKLLMRTTLVNTLGLPTK